MTLSFEEVESCQQVGLDLVKDYCIPELPSARIITKSSPFLVGFGRLETILLNQSAKVTSSWLGVLEANPIVENTLNQNSLAKTQEVRMC